MNMRLLPGGGDCITLLKVVLCTCLSSPQHHLVGYSNRTTTHTPVGNEAQTVYALFDGTHCELAQKIKRGEKYPSCHVLVDRDMQHHLLLYLLPCVLSVL